MSKHACAIASVLLLGALGAQKPKGVIEGRVEPARIVATVVARPVGKARGGPLAAALKAADATTDEQGRYRIEVEPGSYALTAYAPGYVTAGEDSQRPNVTVKAGQTVQGPDFTLVQAAEIRGRVKGVEGAAVVAAVRRSDLPRSQRFSSWARVAMDNGDYRIKDLKPGVYDLVFISSTLGIIDCRGYLLGERDTLSAPDRRAIHQVNSAYARAWEKGKPADALALISTSYSDPQGGTYEKLKEQYLTAERRKEVGWQIARFSWKTLLLQGSQSEAMAVVHQEDQQKAGRSTRPASIADFLVRYVKERGGWKIAGIELIREYAALESRISRITGVPCDLPEKYVARYVGDPALGSILLKPGEVRSGCDFDLARLLK